jgi:hypothetical protein
MKSIYLFLFISCLSCYQVERNCQDFKTGAFQSTVIIDGTTYVSEFTRSNNLQIERFNSKTDSASVRWINDCEMVFRTINPKNRAEQKDVHLKILTTSKDGYTFEYGYVGSPIKQKGNAKRVD